MSVCVFVVPPPWQVTTKCHSLNTRPENEYILVILDPIGFTYIGTRQQPPSTLAHYFCTISNIEPCDAGFLEVQVIPCHPESTKV